VLRRFVAGKGGEGGAGGWTQRRFPVTGRERHQGTVILDSLILVFAGKILNAPAPLGNSSAQNDIARPSCCSTPRLSASRTRASTRSSSTRSIAPISTCARVSLAISCSAEVERSSKVSGAFFCSLALATYIELTKRAYDARLRGSATARDEEARLAGYQDPDLGAAGTKVLDLDRREYPRRPQYFQEDVGLGRGVPRG
jgi:hypothetical protein